MVVAFLAVFHASLLLRRAPEIHHKKISGWMDQTRDIRIDLLLPHFFLIIYLYINTETKNKNKYNITHNSLLLSH